MTRQSNVLTDETKIIQILSNLLNNALRFTREGRIEFGYVLRGDTVEFFVSDTGIGIAPEHQVKVFDRFYQVETPSSKQFSGTGLGLSISKAYVELARWRHLAHLDPRGRITFLLLNTLHQTAGSSQPPKKKPVHKTKV